MGCAASRRGRVSRWRSSYFGFVLAVVATSACASQLTSIERRVTVATGDQTGVYYLLGRALTEIYNRQLTDVASSALETTGSGFNLQAVEEGRAELAFSRADVAYLALQQGTQGRPQPYRNVRAMGVLYVNAVQLVTLRSSNIREVDDLRSRRVGVGAPDSGTELAARIILTEGALHDHIVAEPLTFEEVVLRLQSQAIDAGFLVSGYPVPALASLNANLGIRLIPIGAALAARIRNSSPFYRPIRIPDGTYPEQGGDIATVGVENLLVCRSDLPDELVYQLTRLFFESLPRLAEAHAAAASIDPDQAAAAPIPLHPGAARFFRERDLFR